NTVARHTATPAFCNSGNDTVLWPRLRSFVPSSARRISSMLLVKSRRQLRAFQDKSRCESMIIMMVSKGSYGIWSKPRKGLYIITEQRSARHSSRNPCDDLIRMFQKMILRCTLSSARQDAGGGDHSAHSHSQGEGVGMRKRWVQGSVVLVWLIFLVGSVQPQTHPKSNPPGASHAPAAASSIATPEEVGLSSDRLERVTSAIQKSVDDG